MRLTKAIAKQFPIRRNSGRWDATVKGEDVPQAICKIAGKTLGAASEWLFLVKDEVAGLAWVPPVSFYPALAEQVRARGIKADDPAAVKTIIL